MDDSDSEIDASPSPESGVDHDPNEVRAAGDDERSVIFDYHRTVVGYHGTRRSTAERLVRGAPFRESDNDDDWLGNGIYFWEYAPQQAWWWAERRYAKDEEGPAVVGAMIRLGHCLDFLDPPNGVLLEASHDALEETLRGTGQPLPNNANNHKYRDCMVFEYMYDTLEDAGRKVDVCRAVFVPSTKRYWKRSGVYQGSHIQLCVREPANILSVWHVRRDGRYGLDRPEGGEDAGEG